MKPMIKKHKLPMSFSLKVKQMKDECVKHIQHGRTFVPSVDESNQDETEHQRVNRKAIQSWFKTKKRASDQSKFTRTMLRGHLNENKIKRSMEVEMKKTYEHDDFEFGAGRRHRLCENK